MMAKVVSRSRLRIDQRFTLTTVGIIIFALSGALSGNHLFNNSAAADSARVVSIFHDGQKRIITTEAKTVGQVIERSGLKLGKGDLVEPAANTPVKGGFFNINVYRARPVVVVDGQRLIKTRSVLKSPRRIAAACGLKLYPEDQFSSQTVTNFVTDDSIGQRVVVKRAKPVTVKLDGKQMTVRTQVNKVGELLEKSKIPIGPKDVVTPQFAADLKPGMDVVVTRVTEVVTAQDQVIPRKVQNIDDPTTNRGTSHVKTEGSDGKKRYTYRIHYRDGVETARETLKVDNLGDPVTKVVMVGTKIPDDAWYKLRVCESGNNYSRNSGNGYYGAYQFDLDTWRSNGGVGLPSDAAPAVQDAMAYKVQARRGWDPWPNCKIALGLR